MSSTELALIDIGANLTDPQFQGVYHGNQKHPGDLERVIERAKQNHVKKIIITAGCLQDTRLALQYCEKFDPAGGFLYTTIGVHPTQAYELDQPGILEEMIALARSNASRIVAIGELGLDIAKRHIPCMREQGGVAHSFTGTHADLKMLLDLGCDIGVNGCSLKTLENLEVVKEIPDNRLHFETDAPWCGIRKTHASSSYVTDTFSYGKKPERWTPTALIQGRNEPCTLLHVSQIVAHVKGYATDAAYKTICQQTEQSVPYLERTADLRLPTRFAAPHQLGPHWKVMSALSAANGRGDAEHKSLPLLQERIRRQPDAYAEEFRLQYDHFTSALQLFAVTPQKADKSFLELLMFIAHTVTSYPDEAAPFLTELEGVLTRYGATLHPETRRTSIKALMLLRGKRSVPFMRILSLVFALTDINDKGLRRLLLNFIVRDITRNQLMRSSEKGDIQNFFLSYLKPDTPSGPLKRATRLAIDLFRRNTWRDPRMVNALAQLCISSRHVKVATTVANFLLGNYTPLVDEDEGNSSDEDADGRPVNALRLPIGSKKTRGKMKRAKRELEAEQRKKQRRERREELTCNFLGGGILDMLHNPQAVAEAILARVMRKSQKDTFALRILLLNVVSRLIGRYQLLVLNFYPMMQRFLNPRQKHITTILSILAQGCHELVPPDDLYPVMQCLLEHFIADYQTPEAMAVGLHAAREICTRAPLALTEDKLSDLADFRRYKNRAVMSAARSLINLYRDIYPGLLHRKLRGRTAAIEVQHAQAPEPKYGAQRVAHGIEGAELLGVTTDNSEESEASLSASSDVEDHDSASSQEAESASDADNDTTCDDEENDSNSDGSSNSDSCWETSDEDDGEGSVDGNASDLEGDPSIEETREACRKKRKRSSSNATSDTQAHQPFDPLNDFLTEEQLERLKKLRKSSAGDSGYVSDSEESEVDAAEEGVIQPDTLKSGIKKKGREYRLALLRQSKEGELSFRDRIKERTQKLKASLPNSVQKRNKPLMMVKQKRLIAAKKQQDVATKVARLRQHMKTIKMDTGKKKRYRRG